MEGTLDNPAVVELNDKLDKMEEFGMSKTKKWCSIWRDSIAYMFSDQLSDRKKSKNWEWIIVNHLWPAAMQEMAKLSKIEHKILTNPKSENDADAAEAWQSYLQWEWEVGLNGTGMRLEVLRLILDQKIFGYAVTKVFYEPQPLRSWNEQTRQYEGKIGHTLWHPAEFWASDNEKVDDGPCGTSRYVTLDWAISKWPQFEIELRDEAKKFKEVAGGPATIRGQISTAGTYPGAGTGGIDKGLGTNQPSELLNLILMTDRMGNSTESISDKTEYLQLKETYFFDFSTLPQSEDVDVPAQELMTTGKYNAVNGGRIIDQSGQELTPQTWPKKVNVWALPKYPKGRYIMRAGHTILNPGEESGGDYHNQQWSYSRWPFIVVPHYILPHMWQGSDGVQMYKSAQDMINVSISHLVNNLKMYGNPKVAVETGAIAAPPGQHKTHYRIGAGAGAVIRLVRGGLGRIKIIDPAQLSVGAVQAYQLFSQELKNLIGMQSVAQGEKEPGEMSATQAQHLAISSSDRIYLQSVIIKEWVKQSCRLIGEIAQKNYSAGRMVRIIGEEYATGIIEITKQMKDVRFDVEIEAGSAVPFDEEKRIMAYKMAYDILASPVPNPMTADMLRILKIPNWQKLLLKHQAYQQYIQLTNLYQAVKEGKVTPRDAVNAIAKRAVEVFNQERANQVPTIEDKEKNNAVREKQRA